MGLDTTHDCWHGPYTSFMRWRICLHAAINNEPPSREALEHAWMDGVYDDQSVPINILMNHSDSDGEIPADMCLPLARALEELITKLPDNGPVPIFSARANAIRFAWGLRHAAAANEPVEFH